MSLPLLTVAQASRKVFFDYFGPLHYFDLLF